jgi:L-fuculose-phosphate aldolase
MYEKIKQEIIDTCRQFITEGIIYDTAGNISVRIPETNHVVITPTSIPYDIMKIENIPVLDLKGNDVEKGLKSTSETPMHLAILNAFPEINAVVHTHSLYASAFSINRIPIQSIYLLSLLVGFVPVAKYAPAGSFEIGVNAVNALKENKSSSVLLANHGVLTTAKDLLMAKNIARYLEKIAELQHIAMIHGELTNIPDEEISKYQKTML